MTTTGSPALWALADHFGVVPSPPNDNLSQLLRGWWTLPRSFGCAAAQVPGVPWFVVAPQPSVWCGRCAAERFPVETRCAYCREAVDPPEGVLIYTEMRGGVTVLGHAHLGCHDPEGLDQGMTSANHNERNRHAPNPP